MASGSKANSEYPDGVDLRAELARNWAALSEQRKAVQAVFDKYHDDFLDHPDVGGLHVGLKRIGTRVALPLRYSIRLHVARKWPIGHPMLKQEIDTQQFKHLGVELDVLEKSYRVLSGDSGSTSDTSSDGPMVGGRPISPTDHPDHWGTMGMVVFFGGQPHYLTNQHVAGTAGTSVSESKFGVTSTGETGVIGQVANSFRNSSIDCAIVAPSGNRKRELGILGPDGLLPGIYVTRKLTSVDEHQTEVFKIGARTGFKPVRVGVVESVNASIDVDGLTMTGQISVDSQDNEPIVAPGDSGSIAIVPGEQDGTTVNFVVGLVFGESVPSSSSGAESGHTMLANHFENVESALRISLFPA